MGNPPAYAHTAKPLPPHDRLKNAGWKGDRVDDRSARMVENTSGGFRKPGRKKEMLLKPGDRTGEYRNVIPSKGSGHI